MSCTICVMYTILAWFGTLHGLVVFTLHYMHATMSFLDMAVFGEVIKSFLLEARLVYTAYVSHVHFFL